MQRALSKLASGTGVKDLNHQDMVALTQALTTNRGLAKVFNEAVLNSREGMKDKEDGFSARILTASTGSPLHESAETMRADYSETILRFTKIDNILRNDIPPAFHALAAKIGITLAAPEIS